MERLPNIASKEGKIQRHLGSDCNVIRTVVELGCHCGLPPGPPIDMGGGPLIAGPYEPGPMGPIPGPRGGFIRGFNGLNPGGPTTFRF